MIIARYFYVWGFTGSCSFIGLSFCGRFRYLWAFLFHFLPILTRKAINFSFLGFSWVILLPLSRPVISSIKILSWDSFLCYHYDYSEVSWPFSPVLQFYEDGPFFHSHFPVLVWCWFTPQDFGVSSWYDWARPVDHWWFFWVNSAQYLFVWECFHNGLTFHDYYF